MADTPETNNLPLRPLESFVISLGFWLTLLCASAMYAILSLAPGFVEHARLSRQHDQLIKLSRIRKHEVHHLNRVASAMQKDPDFVNRLAANELSLSPAGSTQFRVANNLGYDARVPETVSNEIVFQEKWYESSLATLSRSSHLRLKWITATLALFTISFLCMNESFFSGRLGRGILSLIATFCDRYRLSPPKLD